MTIFEVEVNVKPSCGGGRRRVKVKAQDQATALVQATLALDQQGVTHFDLISVYKAAN